MSDTRCGYASLPLDVTATTLAINALANAGEDVASLGSLDWILSCQHVEPHPYTGAEPGGWGWSDLSGAVPDADDTPAVRGSVVNFGLPDTTGRTLTPPQLRELARSIERAIRRYEPRIELDRRNAVRIAPSTEKRDEGKLRLEIRGELKSEPAPEWLCIATEIDIETGDCRVTETEGDPDE